MENASAYEAVETIGRERERFMFRVAHNLRAPLAAVVSMLDVLRGGYIGALDETQTEVPWAGRRAGARAESVRRRIDAACRGQAPRRSLVLEDVDLGALAGKVERTYRNRTNEKGLQFEVAVAPGLTAVGRGDAARLLHLLENLVSNAISTPRPGER